jgi:hypothetical protein
MRDHLLLTSEEALLTREEALPTRGADRSERTREPRGKRSEAVGAS